MLYMIAASAIATSVALASPSPQGVAPVTFDESVPEALVSQDALMHHALARTLFQGLPASQQAILSAAGAIGPDTASPVGIGITTQSDLATGTWSIERIQNELGVTFSPEHKKLIKLFESKAAAGEPTPALCLDPATDPKIAQALLLAVDGIIYGNSRERYRVGARWTSTATDGGVSMGQSITLTWSLVPDGTPADGGNSSLFSWLDGVYAGSGGRAEWVSKINLTFVRWGFLSGINYVQELNDDGAAVSFGAQGAVGVRGDVRICAIPIDGNSGILAYNYFPNHGDMFLDTGDSFYSNLSKQSRRLMNVVSHEHGHGFGLDHVCPVEQTKLMEPFVSTLFFGPQIDDIMGIQRTYGDSFEDNDTAGVAYPLGSFVSGDAFTKTQLSIDDNSDVDYYEVIVNAASQITVTVTPTNSIYLEGPQNNDGSCSNGSVTDYSNIHDLSFELRDANDTLITSVNNTGAGSPESAAVAAPAAGTYYIVVRGDNTNSLQLYDITLGFQTTVVCQADLTGDGVVDNGDIGAFVTLFLAGDMAVDFTGDGFIDNGDIGAFVALFLAGCP